ncbi:hypothetical protein MVES_001670 [Malassezia vespertilionis]|uniref:Borealin N-terminal domain-containing protein n=1 Tax=Malassezia vespertilionis TaxID=2020962 RepID=A0A2N1JD13_9BASI|nr:hypothetical protein MVES_001670 [Malassezia vespertilionis]
MGRKRTRGQPQAQRAALTEDQIEEVLVNYDLECEKLLARLERGGQRALEAARAQMDARVQKIPHDVRNISLQAYYDMHTAAAAAKQGRHIPPLAMASMPDTL